MYDYCFKNSRYQIKLYKDKSFINGYWVNKSDKIITFEINPIGSNKTVYYGLIQDIDICYLLDHSYTLTEKVKQFLKNN